MGSNTQIEPTSPFGMQPILGPAVTTLQTYDVIVESEMGRIESIQNQDGK